VEVDSIQFVMLGGYYAPYLMLGLVSSLVLLEEIF